MGMLIVNVVIEMVVMVVVIAMVVVIFKFTPILMFNAPRSSPTITNNSNSNNIFVVSGGVIV